MNNYLWILVLWSVGCAPPLDDEWDWNNADETSANLTESDTAADSGEPQTVFHIQVDATNHDEPAPSATGHAAPAAI